MVQDINKKKLQTIKNIDSNNHVQGKSIYVDDVPVRVGTLHGAVFGSPIAHGKIKNLDISKALALPLSLIHI